MEEYLQFKEWLNRQQPSGELLSDLYLLAKRRVPRHAERLFNAYMNDELCAVEFGIELCKVLE